MNEKFLLKSELAQKIYNQYVKDLPIIDYHNHLAVNEIATNYKFRSITDAWLTYDHYKWRLMRSSGYDENYITGSASDSEKFNAFCHTLEAAIGNSVLIWSQMELKYYFDIDVAINRKNADSIYKDVNAKLETSLTNDFIEKSNVEILCTTDLPTDDLKYHQQIAKSDSKYKVLPTFRPDKFLVFSDVIQNIKLLENTTDIKITSLDDYLQALEIRLKYFIDNGCLLSDHGIDKLSFEMVSKEEAEQLFVTTMNSKCSLETQTKLWSYVVVHLLKLYKQYDIKVQLHIGPVRNTNAEMKESIGADSGFDSIGNSLNIEALVAMFNAVGSILPDMVVYNINPVDNFKLATLCNNFRCTNGTIKFGAAWWFNDNYTGIINQMQTLTETGLFGNFLGMLTDSRSVLSLSRHDYFRRILCSYLADMYENNLYFDSVESLGKMAANISYYNVKEFLGV